MSSLLKNIKINTLSFDQDIEQLVTKNKMSYLDAIIMWTESKGVEIEFIASLIKKDTNLKSKIKAEAEDLNFLEKGAQLPF